MSRTCFPFCICGAIYTVILLYISLVRHHDQIYISKNKFIPIYIPHENALPQKEDDNEAAIKCPDITNIHNNSKTLPANKKETLHVAYDLPLYLYSDGGSGNTWIRVLLEYITGISTGSVFADPKYKQIFNRDNYCHNQVLVCKAHPIWFLHQVPPVSYKPEGVWQKSAKKVIGAADGLVWIIRNPWHSMWSLYQLRTSSYVHSGKIAIKDFNAYDFYMDIYMGKREISLVEKWKLQFKLVDVLLNDKKRNWKNDSSRVVQIKYENILNKQLRVNEILKVLNHLYVNISHSFKVPAASVDITYDELIERIKCAFNYKTNENTFHRSHNMSLGEEMSSEYAYMSLGEEKICKIWHSLQLYAEPLGYKQLFVDKFRCEDMYYWHNITDIDNINHPNMTRFTIAIKKAEKDKQARKARKKIATQQQHTN